VTVASVDQASIARELEFRPTRRPLGRVLAGLWWFARRKPLGAFGGITVVVMIVVAVSAQWIAPYWYDDQSWGEAMQGPSLKHWFGTDDLGRDMLSRVIYGARVSVVIGFSAVAISVVLATFIGIVSGYYGGWFDTLFQRLVDIWMSFPALVLLIVIVSTFSRGGDFWHRMMAIIIVMGIIMAAGSSRVIRGAAIAVKHNQYVEAARCIGASDVRILAQHVFPNVFAVVIILATVQLGAAILAESSISFLGWGVPPPFPSWGQMLSNKGILFMRAHPWIALWPGLAIALAVYGFNMLGDGLRDVLDPRLRGAGARR
jgi:peptide/nickel transport system permease protein